MTSCVKVLVVFAFFVQYTFNYGNCSDTDSLINSIEKQEDNLQKCRILIEIATNMLDTDPKESILYAEKAFHIAFTHNYENEIANSYLIQGIANENLSKYDLALDKYFSSLVIYRHINNQDQIAEINYRLGRVSKTIGNYEEALEYCLNALRNRDVKEAPLKVSNIYNTLGSIYKYIGDYNESLNYYFKCMNIQKLHRVDGVSAGTYNNIGIVYKLMGQQEQALEYYNKSLAIRIAIKDTLGIASSYNNIGAIYLDAEKLDSALYFLRKSQFYKEKMGDQESLIHVYINLATYYFKIKAYDEAIIYTNKSLVIAQNLNVTRSVANAYELFKDIYKAQNQFEKALDYQTRFSQVNDSILNTEKSMRMAQLAVTYQDELNKIEHDIKDQRKSFINYGIYGILFFSFIILLFVYLNLRSKLYQNKLRRINLEMEKEKLTTSLETKNRELTRNIIHLTEKNELLHDMRRTLQKLMCNLKDENKPLIQNIINDLKASSNNKIWDEFEIQFINVHKDFYDNLQKKHPELTQNEKRLAAFLKLNMATKEISMITRQSSHSITVARTRLRKKLGLANTDTNLGSFLAKY